MNSQSKSPSKPFKLDWKKAALIALVVAIAGYQWYTGNDSNDNPVAVVNDDNQPTDKNENTKAPKKSNSNVGSKANRAPSDPYLKSAGGKNLKSPAGLVYTGGQKEHRTDHVLRHAHDIPNRDGPHGVFLGRSL